MIEWYTELGYLWCYVKINNKFYWVYFDIVQQYEPLNLNSLKLITMEEAKIMQDFKTLKHFAFMKTSNLYRALYE